MNACLLWILLCAEVIYYIMHCAIFSIHIEYTPFRNRISKAVRLRFKIYRDTIITFGTCQNHDFDETATAKPKYQATEYLTYVLSISCGILASWCLLYFFENLLLYRGGSKDAAESCINYS